MQSSFATFKQNYFSSNGKVALRYMGLMGYFEGNGFTTNPAGELILVGPGGQGPVDVFLQYGLVDPGATTGIGLSNAVQVTLQP